jgi:hypothetical protein
MNDNIPVRVGIGDFASMFNKACGHVPYAYQCRLACGDGADIGTPRGADSGPRMLFSADQYPHRPWKNSGGGTCLAVEPRR